MRAIRITPKVGETYLNKGGGSYICRDNFRIPTECSIMERVSDGYTLTAHGVMQYDDGSIEWDFSTDGHWAR